MNIKLTKSQVKTLVEILTDSMENSGWDTHDFSDVALMTLFKDRADVLLMLQTSSK